MSGYKPLGFTVDGLKHRLDDHGQRITNLERLGDWEFDDEFEPLGGSGLTTNAAQLLCMTVSGDSIASGGDYVAFTSILAQHAFATVTAAGETWIHPTDGVYMLAYEHAWVSYEGGGTIQLEIDGTLVAGGVIASGTSGTKGRGTIAYVATKDSVGRIKVTQSSGAAQTCAATIHVAITDPTQNAVVPVVDTGTPGTLIDTFYMDTALHSQHSSVMTYAESVAVLAAATTYSVVIDGNWDFGGVGGSGAPDAILYTSPSTGGGTGKFDAEFVYAGDSSRTYPIAERYLVANLGSGFGVLPTPTGWPMTAPTAGHSYTYTVTGQGATLQVAIIDYPLYDNDGQLRIRIYTT